MFNILYKIFYFYKNVIFRTLWNLLYFFPNSVFEKKKSVLMVTFLFKQMKLWKSNNLIMY